MYIRSGHTYSNSQYKVTILLCSIPLIQSKIDTESALKVLTFVLLYAAFTALFILALTTPILV